MLNRVQYLALVWLFAGLLSAGTDGPVFTAYTTQDGLSNNTVTSVLQDQQGFLWVGTRDGLNQFDGYRFKHFKYGGGNGDGLSSSRILSLAQDDEGRLWIGTDDAGVTRYDIATKTFKHYAPDENQPGSLLHHRVRALLYDRHDNLWVGTDGGLSLYDPETDSFKTYRRDPSNPNSIGHNRVLTLFEDSHGVLWIGTSGGLNSFDPRVDGFTAYRRRGRNASGLRNNVINGIAEDRVSGMLWIGTDGGLHSFDHSTFRVYRNDPDDPNSLRGDVVFAVNNDSQGVLWAGTEQGLNRFDWLHEDFVQPVDDSVGAISVLYEDRGGTLWLGTNGNGLFKSKRGAAGFDLVQHDPNDPDNSISQSEVTALFEDPSGRLWVGSNGGVDVIASDPDESFQLVGGPNPTDLSSDRVRVILGDQSGMIWIGTNGAGLNRLDLHGSITRYRPTESPDSLSSDRVWTLLEDEMGRFWVGTQNGLNLMKRDRGTFTRFQHDPDDPNTLGPNAIWALAEGNDGTIWLGTEGNGLSRMNVGEGGFSHFRNDPDNAQSLSHNHVLSVYEDRHGMIWAGTWGGGLNRLDPMTGQVRVWREADGLQNDVIFGILGDDLDHLWLSTNLGIVRFEPETNRFHAFDAGDGLQSGAFEPGSYCRGRDGALYFGGQNGFNRFRPDELRIGTRAPPLALTAVRTFKQTLGHNLTADQVYVLDHTDNFLTFEFAALDFADPEANQFSFYMEGVDNDWQTTHERSRNYPQLDPGNYIFWLKGADSKGVWNEVPLAMEIRIEPPWWQEPWFITLEVLLVLGLLAALFLGQRARLKKQEAEALLAFELQAKTQELEEARSLQLSMLPRSLPAITGLEVSVYMQTAAEVGGDYYDFFEHGDGTLTAAIGDATGHGLMAGTFVAATKSLFLSLAEESDLTMVMRRASKALRGMGLRKMFMALALARLTENRLQLVGGGMPPVLVYRAEVNHLEEVVMRGLPLGTPPFPYRITEVILEPGDMVLFQSDGLEEIFNADSHMLGSDAIRECFLEAAPYQTPDQVIETLAALGRTWARGRAPDDDVTMMVFRYFPPTLKEPLS